MRSINCLRAPVVGFSLFGFIPGAVAQSQSDVSGKIQSTLPDNARGQITASGLRSVLNALNGARGQPNGIANLGADGRLGSEATPAILTPDKLTLPSIDQGSVGDASGLCVRSPGLALCRPNRERVQDTFTVPDYKTAASVDGTNDDIAIQNAVNAALAKGSGQVKLPPRQGCYVLSAPVNLGSQSGAATPIIFDGGGMGACIQPGTTMTSMFKAGGRWLVFQNVQLANVAGRATNGIELSCQTGAGNTNNRVYIEKNGFFSFTNAVKNTNCDGWVVRDNWFQNQTGWDVWSADNATNSRITGNYSLGSAGNVLIDRVSYAPEGYYIDNNAFLPTTGKGIVIRAGLSFFIRGNQIDQANDSAITLDATNNPIADFGISDNWLGTKAGATDNRVGLDMIGNVVDGRVLSTTVNGWTNCGVRLKGLPSGAVQRMEFGGLRGSNNGTGFSTGDFCTDATTGGVGAFTVHDSFLLSSGNSINAVTESSGSFGTFERNRFAGVLTRSTASVYRDNLGDDRDAATGKYVAWPTYSAVPTCASGTLGTGASSFGSYYRDRNKVTVRVRVIIPDATALGTCTGNFFIPLPATIAPGSQAVLAGRNNGSGTGAGRMLQGYSTSGAAFVARDYTDATAANAGADLFYSGTYEAAP